MLHGRAELRPPQVAEPIYDTLVKHIAAVTHAQAGADIILTTGGTIHGSV